MTSRFMPRCLSLTASAFAFAAMLVAGAPPSFTTSAAAADASPVSDWPCVWHKVDELSAATIWDGPDLATAADWQKDEKVRTLSGYIISRRIKLEDAEAAIKKFAEEQPATTRDQKLTELFAAALSRTNDDRKTVMSGIVRFHKRQLARAAEIEKQGIVVPKEGDPVTAEPLPAGEIDKLSDKEEKYKWEVRVFQERQQNIPIACEIPQLMDERAGAVARAIRALMKS